jgi:hypothetical protein
MNDKLQQIIDSSVISPCEEKVTISKDCFEWFIEQARKIQEIESYIANIYGYSRDPKRVEVADELLDILKS